MKRIAKAKRELEDIDFYEHVVCNDDLQVAIQEVREIILNEMKKQDNS